MNNVCGEKFKTSTGRYDRAHSRTERLNVQACYKTCG
jgi:hypothetical protein